MKKIICWLSLSIFLSVVIFTACACGGSMYGWPTLDLNLDIESYDEVSLEYNQLPYGRSKSEDHFYGSSSDREIIEDIYCLVDGLPYSEKTFKRIDTEKYWANVIIKLIKDDEEFVFKFYSYGIYDGYFIFDNGEIHKYRGDFVGLSYGNFKDKLSCVSGGVGVK